MREGSRGGGIREKNKKESSRRLTFEKRKVVEYIKSLYISSEGSMSQVCNQVFARRFQIRQGFFPFAFNNVREEKKKKIQHSIALFSLNF